jgi:hypothetical protein
MEDQWIESVERMEEMMDPYVHVRPKAQARPKASG